MNQNFYKTFLISFLLFSPASYGQDANGSRSATVSPQDVYEHIFGEDSDHSQEGPVGRLIEFAKVDSLAGLTPGLTVPNDLSHRLEPLSLEPISGHRDIYRFNVDFYAFQEGDLRALVRVSAEVLIVEGEIYDVESFTLKNFRIRGTVAGVSIGTAGDIP